MTLGYQTLPKEVKIVISAIMFAVLLYTSFVKLGNSLETARETAF